ncbi:unnamed protein product, partial [Musa textilis]
MGFVSGGDDVDGSLGRNLGCACEHIPLGKSRSIRRRLPRRGNGRPSSRLAASALSSPSCFLPSESSPG